VILTMATESTESTEDKDTFVEYSVFFRGFRGQ
jgi:hypothetical protein